MIRRLAAAIAKRLLARSLFPLLRFARWTKDAHFLWHVEKMFEAAGCRTRDRDCPWVPIDPCRNCGHARPEHGNGIVDRRCLREGCRCSVYAFAGESSKQGVDRG